MAIKKSGVITVKNTFQNYKEKKKKRKRRERKNKQQNQTQQKNSVLLLPGEGF